MHVCDANADNENNISLHYVTDMNYDVRAHNVQMLSIEQYNSNDIISSRD